MAKETKIYGTGITKKPYILHSGPDAALRLENQLRRLSDESKKCGQFDATINGVVEQWKEILSNADEGPFKEDSLHDFAHRIINKYNNVKFAIANGNADQAARFAVVLGELCKEAEMKFNWEDHALRGKKIQEKAQEGGHKKTTKDRDIELARRYMAERDTRGANTPKLTFAKFGKLVGLDESTVRKAVRRGLTEVAKRQK